MEIYVFARFHAKPGNEAAVEQALLEVAAPSREEPGCVALEDFQSIRDPCLFFVHSRWKDEAAFEEHARLPHTVRFLERVEPLIDHPLDVARTKLLGSGRFSHLLRSAAGEVREYCRTSPDAPSLGIAWLQSLAERMEAASSVDSDAQLEREIDALAHTVVDSGPSSDRFAPSFGHALDALQRLRKRRTREVG